MICYERLYDFGFGLTGGVVTLIYGLICDYIEMMTCIWSDSTSPKRATIVPSGWPL